MDFEDRLLSQGFNARFHTFVVPFDLRTVKRADAAEDAEDEPEESKGEGGDGGDGEANGLRLEGQAVPFDSPTRIFDWFDGEFDEQFRMGSLAGTIKNDRQVMLFDHGYHPLMGDIPIADIRNLEETKPGLQVEADMFDSWMTQPIQGPIRSGLMGMSIMFRPLSQLIEERDDDVPLVTVTEAELRELGPVTFPAYADTNIGLRSMSKRFMDAARRHEAGVPRGGNKPAATFRPRLELARLDLMEML